MIIVYIKVKFRWLGITFGTVEKTFTESLPFPIPKTANPVNYHDHGIDLVITIKPQT